MTADTMPAGTRPVVRPASGAATRVRLSRSLPVGATLAARVSDRVEAETVIARGRSNRRVLRLPAGGNFELLKKPGDPVRAGETVAAAEELFGLGLREYVAPFDGVVESVNANRTALILAETQDDIRALVPGVVAETSPTKVALDVPGHLLRGFFGFGRPVAGKLLAIGELHTEAEVRKHLGPEVRGKVVLAESFAPPPVLPALAELGAAGFICGGLDFGPLWDLISPSGRFPAGRGLPTLVVLGGFGAHRISPDAREILASGEGRSVYVSGPNVGRLLFAGPPFPEVVVPLG